MFNSFCLSVCLHGWLAGWLAGWLPGWLAGRPLVYFISEHPQQILMIFHIGSHTRLLFCKFNFGPHRSTTSAAASVAIAGGLIVVAAAVRDCKFRKRKILNGNTFSVLIALQFVVPFRFTTSKFIIQATVIASRSVNWRN
jgi:hypothetical protein